MNVIPEFPMFVPLTISHAAELKHAFERAQPQICEHTLGILYGYRSFYGFQVSRLVDSLCILCWVNRRPTILMPIGGNRMKETVEQCLFFLREKFGGGQIHALPRQLAEIWSNETSFELEDDRDNYDYLYRVKDLADLSGSDYHAKKNLIAQFKRKYSFEYHVLTPELVRQCLGLQQKWCRLRDCSKDP
jgi:hypothetical protein